MLIHKTLEKSAELFPEKEGLVFGELRFTYRHLWERVSRLAGALGKLGIKKGDRVAVLMENTHHYFEFFHAIAVLGAVAVPINFRLSESEIESILKDSGASAFFISEKFLSVAESIKNRIPPGPPLQGGDRGECPSLQGEELKGITFIFAGENGPSWALDYEKLLENSDNTLP